MPSIALHTCCAPCAIWPYLKLKNNHIITLFYTNSNISSREEYKKRLTELQKWTEKNKINLVIDEYNHSDWLEYIKGYEKEPEKGQRCEKCFEYRLRKTLELAQELFLR